MPAHYQDNLEADTIQRQQIKPGALRKLVEAGTNPVDIETYMTTKLGYGAAQAREGLYGEMSSIVMEQYERGVTEEQLSSVLIDNRKYDPTFVQGLLEYSKKTTESQAIRETEYTPQQLETRFRNINQKYSTMGKEVAGFISPKLREEAKAETTELSYDIISGLRKHGLDAYLDKSGQIMHRTAEGDQPIRANIVQDLVAQRGEITGALSGALGGAAAGAKIPGPPLVKAGAAIVGGIAGSVTGTMAGRGIDILRNSLETYEDISRTEAWEQMKDAGAADAVLGALGTTIFTTGKYAILGIKRGFDLLVNGNTAGAYTALKDITGVSDEQAKALIKEWEGITGARAPGITLATKAMGTLPQMLPGGEEIIKGIGSRSQIASTALLRSIDTRAQDLLTSVEKISSPQSAKIIADDLSNYRQGVKDYFGWTKEYALKGMEDSSFRFNYDKLAIEPILDELNAKITNPATKELFLNYAKRIRALGGKTEKEVAEGPKFILPLGVQQYIAKEVPNLREFANLLELRSVVNEFKYNRSISSVADFKALNKVIHNIDSTITKAVKKDLPEADTWLREWQKANTEYHKMKTVEKNILYKALTRPGATPKLAVNALSREITALDGTFMSVIGKLPMKTRILTEGAVMDNITKKYTLGLEGGSNAIDFVALSKELKYLPFTTPQARELKRTVAEFAKIYRNDPKLFHATGGISVSGTKTYLSTTPEGRTRMAALTYVFNWMRKRTPGQEGRTLAVIDKVTKLMENPRNAKAMDSVLKALPNDPQLEALIKQMAIETVQFGEKEAYPKVPIYRSAAPGFAQASSKGKLGKGRYFFADEASARAAKGTVTKEEIDPARLAIDENIKDILGIEDFDPKMLREDPTLIETLKDKGYLGFTENNVVVLFD